jgi:hypothetical protein
MMKKRRRARNFYLLVLLAVLGCPTIVRGQENDQVFLSEQRSIANSNSEAWKKYDLLLKESTFYRGTRPKGVPESATRWIRCAVDWEVGEVFCFIRLEGDGVIADDSRKAELDAQASKKVYQHLIARSGETSRNRKLSKPNQKMLVSEPHRLFNFFEVDIPDLRYVGIQPYGRRHHPVSTFEELVKSGRSTAARG